VNQSNARFDEKKLAHMNMVYLLALPTERFAALAKAYFQTHAAGAAVLADEAYFREIMLLAQPKIKGMEELPAYTAYFFTEDFAIDPKVKDKIMVKGEPKTRLGELIAALATMEVSSDTAIEEAIKALATSRSLGFGDYQAVARLALSGTNAGPSITAMIRVLGRERATARLAKFLAGA